VSDFRRPLHDEPTPVTLADDASIVMGRGLFDDEVAIDFPAIGAVVDRMRASLLGAERETIEGRAAISLSQREALDGATVPIELPLRRTCHLCGGRGESWSERCASCAGSGERSTSHRFSVLVPAGVAHGTRFRLLVALPQGLPTRIEVTVLVA
jgi:hypothetical protein